MLVLSIRESRPGCLSELRPALVIGQTRTTIEKITRKGANIFGQRDFGWLGPPIWQVARSH